MILPSPPIGPCVRASWLIASRMRIVKNHALLYVMPSIRCSCLLDMPFLLAAIR